MDKLRNEYEMKISIMRKQIGQLEGDMMVINIIDKSLETIYRY